MIDIEWDAADPSGSRRGYRKASTIHGWITKLRGTLTDNERVRSRGIREMREARAIRAHMKKKGSRGRGAWSGRGGIIRWFSFWPSRRSSPQGQVVVRRRDYASNRRGSERSGHSSHHPKPHHHGHNATLKGRSTGNNEVVRAGTQMNKGALRERHSERRRPDRRGMQERPAFRSEGSRTKRRS